MAFLSRFAAAGLDFHRQPSLRNRRSPLTQGRGLKQGAFYLDGMSAVVAPHAGARIETARARMRRSTSNGSGLPVRCTLSAGTTRWASPTTYCTIRNVSPEFPTSLQVTLPPATSLAPIVPVGREVAGERRWTGVTAPGQRAEVRVRTRNGLAACGAEQAHGSAAR